ncbi:MAG: GNAT family N-acetyltransferase [Hyphomicrobiaceae bacterium]|nr:GNAT family N-acetyltransferase [Hyphomicrobiaceae bacterium]
MSDQNPGLTFRAATPEDADHLAKFINYAGEGMPLYLWERMAEKGETPWDVGRRRARRMEGGFSFLNATIAEADGEVAGCLIGYALPEKPEAIDYETMPAMFVPLQELENLAPKTWYVNVLGVHPHLRGAGVGTALLKVAEERATQENCTGLSLIVAGANAGARRLYERCGYEERANREMVKDNWANPSTNWVLLTK